MGTPNNALWNNTLFGGSGSTTGSVLVSDMIYTALRMAGVLGAAGRGPATAEVSDAFNALNGMLDAWNTERLIVYNIQRNVYPTVAGQQTYQIGPGAVDYNAPRPVRIDAASILSLNNPAQPLELPVAVIEIEQWQQIPVKSITSTLPNKLYYDNQNPIGNINLWPIPSAAPSLVLYVWQSFGAFSAVTDRTFLAPGYLNAIEWNLAAELWGRFPRSILGPTQVQNMMQKAMEYKDKIKSINAPVLLMATDSALRSRSSWFNWLTGE